MTTPPTLSNALSFGLQGRVVIVTGAANGIGEACARRFAAEAAHVVLADVNSERGAAVAAELRSAGHSAGFMACNVSRKADVDALVEIPALLFSWFSVYFYLSDTFFIWVGNHKFGFIK